MEMKGFHDQFLHAHAAFPINHYEQYPDQAAIALAKIAICPSTAYPVLTQGRSVRIGRMAIGCLVQALVVQPVDHPDRTVAGACLGVCAAFIAICSLQ